MEKTQADSIVRAILEPDLRVQEELRHKRAVEAAQLARKRIVAGYSLVGSGTGAVIGYFTDIHFSQGLIWGALAASALGWLVTRRNHSDQRRFLARPNRR
ncbi:hypothetical protein [[Pseudomonas] boreopolis]|uniref:hypothetical protein n=1 Tax=Xanthomonas boreopolis TaxID=86183 RepID=UPI003D9BC069